MYIVQFNDGRTLEVPKGEARFWAWLSRKVCSCNVFDGRGFMQPLLPTDIT